MAPEQIIYETWFLEYSRVFSRLVRGGHLPESLVYAEGGQTMINHSYRGQTVTDLTASLYACL